MDREEFDAWKESTATREIFAKLAEQGKDQLMTLSDTFLAMLAGTPAEWAAAQPAGAYTRGAAEQKAALSALTYDDLFEEETE